MDTNKCTGVNLRCDSEYAPVHMRSMAHTKYVTTARTGSSAAPVSHVLQGAERSKEKKEPHTSFQVVTVFEVSGSASEEWMMTVQSRYCH